MGDGGGDDGGGGEGGGRGGGGTAEAKIKLLSVKNPELIKKVGEKSAILFHSTVFLPNPLQKQSHMYREQ